MFDGPCHRYIAELSDVRRKRTRRPQPHAGRSPRSFEKELHHPALQSPAPANGPIKSPPLPRPQSSLNDFSSSAPHDTSYEEMTFTPPLCRPQSKLETPIREVKPMRQLPEKKAVTPPKKPLGILKTPGVYSTNHPSTRNEAGRLSTLAGYIPGETWPVQKNVQWDSSHKDEDKEDWDSRIDESKVIKEFSYQYIRQDDIEEEPVKMSPDKPTDSSVTLVQSRIRSFESGMDSQSSPEKDSTMLQEPLKMSPPQSATEVQVSRLLESPKKPTAVVIREFALGEPKFSPEAVVSSAANIDDDSEEVTKQPNKSVKDLLADFERKSQQVQQQQEHDKQQKSVKHRGVFSDTETLLYDTGSDLDQPDDEEAERIVPKYKEQPDDQPRQIQCKINGEPSRDLANTTDDAVNPAYMRLSVTESLVTHGDRLSGESDDASPTPMPHKQSEDSVMEEHYLPMSPRKAVLDPDSDDRSMPNAMESLLANMREESSYVEMSQNGSTRSLLTLSLTGSKQGYTEYSTLDNMHYEFVCVADNKMEPVYMEVNQLTRTEEDKSALSNSKEAIGEVPNSRGELPDILTALKSDSSDADDESSKDLDSIDAPRHPRFSLSDTFRPASYYLGASQTLIAELHDSSDSELVSPPPIPTSPPPMDDLDSLEMHDSLDLKKLGPQVALARDYNSQRDSPKSWNKPAAQVEVRRSPSRFSETTMSSTFHDSRMSLESASGSDSVELRNSEEEAAAAARDRQLKRRPVSDDMCEVLDSLDELESLGSRFDGTSIDLDQYLEELQARDAFNVDLYTKDLSYNSIYGLNENMLVAADKLHKSTYPENLGKSTGTTESNNSLDQPFRYGTRSKTSSASSLPSMRVSEAPLTTSHQHSQSFTGDAHYENVTSFSPLRGSPAVVMENEILSHHHDHGYRPTKTVPSPLATVVATHSRDSSYSFISGTASVANYSAQRPASAQSSLVQSTNSYVVEQTQRVSQLPYHSRSASQDSAHYSLSPNHRSSSSQDSSQYQASTSTVVRAASTNPQDQSGAPYYYSDLQAANAEAHHHQRIEAHHHQQQQQRPCAIAHTSRLPQLNNQRGDAAGLNKRNDIGRIVNPIVRQMPRQIQVDDIDEARRIAAELRKTTCQLLAEDKAALVDRRNFYEADTLRRVKSTEPLPDVAPTDLNARNLYPQGLRNKSGSQTQLNADSSSGSEFPSTAQTSHRRSRSLEGLLDDAGLQTLVEQRNRANRQQQAVITAQLAQPQQQPQPANHRPEIISPTDSSTFQGEDPWEQDSLWRESLRRVSLRHARSLDNLDTPAATTTPRSATPANQETANKSRVKITRGVTYVNDSVANCVERPRVKRRGDEDEDDAYESLAMDRIGTGGYIWDPENEAYRKPEHFLGVGNPAPERQQQQTTAAAASSSSSSFELDREKLRQWDLLSSGCLLQEQQRTSMALAAAAADGAGLPTTTTTSPTAVSAATARSAVVTGCGSVADALPRRSRPDVVVDRLLPSTTTATTMKTTTREEDEEVTRLVAARSNGAGEWRYRSGAGLAYRRD